MKMLRLFPLLTGLLVIVLTSCKEDIDFNGDFQETAVVYGLLNQADSIHYIKITRAFGGSNNSLEVAQIPDSSYFPQIEVIVDEVINNNVTRSWTLGDTLLTNKQEGVFYSPDQKVYYFKTTSAAPLVANAKYKMRANVNNGEFIVYGETNLVKDLSITVPAQFAAFTFATANVNLNGYANSGIHINPGTSEVLDVRLEIAIDEYFNGVPQQKLITWKIGELSGDQITGTSSPFNANGKTFYQIIRDNVTNDPSINKRQLAGIRLTATGGTEDLNKYILLNKPSSTLAQNKPSFTNLSTSDGRRAVGLFSARSAVSQYKPKWTGPYRAIDASSMKELCAGQITGGLFFCSDFAADANTPYFCN